MKLGFYPKLAWDGIRKNKRLYIPYILTCVGMVMMYYIILFLGQSPTILALPGGVPIVAMLQLGSWIIAFFSALFLFYTNSFLIRRRKKEFGLYNILGMGKRNISKILFWETLIISAIALLLGLTIGVILSKLFELLMLNLTASQINYEFTISFQSLLKTALVFGVIFILIFLNALRQISLSNPVNLLRGENIGEKPPKANWFMSVCGLVLLTIAYYLAVTQENPVKALGIFFVAVLLVIAATYLLFISGSVALCQLLQKNKKFYYKAKNFVSVSSMSYRMNRNGAGLASICVLLTMVLVMLSGTTAMFVGTEDSLHARYPNDINMEVNISSQSEVREQEIQQHYHAIQTILDEHHVEAHSEYDCLTAETSGVLVDGVLYSDGQSAAVFNTVDFSNVVLAFFGPISDYNRMMGENVTLEDGEVLIYPFRTEYTAPTFQVSGGTEYKVKAVADKFVYNGEAAMTIMPSIFIFVPDFDAAVTELGTIEGFTEGTNLQYQWRYGIDLDIPEEEQEQIYQQLKNTECFNSVNIEWMAGNRDDFYSLYGGLFFLGIILSIVFLTAAVLIIYYKQISEGYEDQARFEIMQKVGMTKKDIRKSINAQMLMVFFMPLLIAGVHLCFAFPIIRRLLLMFNLWNTGILIATTVVCYLIFGLFYALVYRITSNAYYAIVSGAKEE